MKNQNSTWNSLRMCSIFANIADKQFDVFIKKYQNQMIYRKYKNGETIFHASDTANQIAVILSGQIKVEKILPNGTYLTIATKKCGDMIGEAAVFSRIALYPCELSSDTDCELIFFEKEIMLKILSEYPEALSIFLQELSTMTYALQQRVELLSYSGICQKIAFFLLSQYNITKDPKIKIPGTITDMSEQLKVSRTSLHREISKLKKDQIISIEKGYIQILDIISLKNLLI